ncbi:hypothetical protein [Chryseobacterium sp. HMWF035]|uniref:hypothetical protein n=1 Tax=Chryseobacterium sp. HMWF035 TaxID=2056868 RepID=UPI000D58331A|nr:hypothetical protein [Chryseobacterium sp. HMWF035]PVV54845.1 hypothetical protein DD829_16630 [Chryseobacterium sp. HMWF035]
MIKKITIENIKGISNKTFDLNITPNKPSILVAPNGFGKSSFAIAFKSMNQRRIKLNEDDLHENNISLQPKILIEYQTIDGTILNLEATASTNTIYPHLDYFVINNQLKPRGIGSQYGGRATAVLDINNIVLIDSIPPNIPFQYHHRNYKQKFGVNSKILPNATVLFQNKILIEKISENYLILERANGLTFQNKINNVISQINENPTTMTVDKLLNWIDSSLLSNLQQIPHLNTIASIINDFDLGLGNHSEIKSYLLAIQCIWLFNENIELFKNACKYSNYLLEKSRFDTTLSQLNCTWKGIRSSQTNGQLVIKFPKAIDISNGQRDILTFVSMLFKAQRSLKKMSNILIIDEVFDYLDDANLIAAQYYITLFIKEFKNSNKRIYPIILTHLNPLYFKNYAFSDQKIYFLNKSTATINPNLINLLRKRNDILIKDDVSKYLLHYHPNHITKRSEFRSLGLSELWGENNNFQLFLDQEVSNYLNDREYCPFAICGAVRIKIEEIAFNKITSPIFQQTFLDTWKTREKLDYALSIGILSPETHYLLGIVYNEGMHWKDNIDNVTPITNKLENLTIKNMIKEVFQ